MKKIELTKKEVKMIELCDDNLGFTSLISKQLYMTKNQVIQIGESLIKKGLLTKTKSTFGDKEFWYEPTLLGRNLLNNKEHSMKN